MLREDITEKMHLRMQGVGRLSEIRSFTITQGKAEIAQILCRNAFWRGVVR